MTKQRKTVEHTHRSVSECASEQTYGKQSANHRNVRTQERNGMKRIVGIRFPLSASDSVCMYASQAKRSEVK